MPVFLAQIQGASHISAPGMTLGACAAWLRWQLMGDMTMRKQFVGDDCVLCMRRAARGARRAARGATGRRSRKVCKIVTRVRKRVSPRSTHARLTVQLTVSRFARTRTDLASYTAYNPRPRTKRG
ncbi:MAG: hypothetical protein RL701_7492 [Pseudomonadota bacterium]